VPRCDSPLHSLASSARADDIRRAGLSVRTTSDNSGQAIGKACMMPGQIGKQRDLLLLLSLLLVILMHPLLDHGTIRRLILAVLTFVPLVLATIKISKRKRWLWPFVLLISGAVICGIGGAIFSNEPLLVLQWAFVTAAFALSVIGLFSYLQEARTVTTGHLYTAASIYLLTGMLWFSLYSAIAKVYPGSFVQTTTGATNRPTDLLYFSLVTLTTLGYGDILPGYGGVRILAALEAGTGVLYVAITVALLVSGYKQRA
jgi:Ion channel